MRFDHLPALAVLDVDHTAFSDAALAASPRSLTRLIAAHSGLTGGARFAHLRRLRNLFVDSTGVGDASLASMPPRLRWLDATNTALTAAAHFGHLRHLRRLCVCRTGVGAAALATAAPSVQQPRFFEQFPYDYPFPRRRAHDAAGGHAGDHGFGGHGDPDA